MPQFILGAGFNADAFREAQLDRESDPDCHYPLLNELEEICFDQGTSDHNLSIENRFKEAVNIEDFEPIKKLSLRLQKADDYVGRKLRSGENCYLRFFESFSDSCFLSFNYDALAEIILHKIGAWYPCDGFGVPVLASCWPEHLSNSRSRSLVLHLHGSLYVRTSTDEFIWNPQRNVSELRARRQALFSFDPDRIAGQFPGFNKVFGPDTEDTRIIPPIPDKAVLSHHFAEAMGERAIQMIGLDGTVAAVGYSFNPNDESSFQPLLNALSTRNSSRLLVICPEARSIVSRLRQSFPAIIMEPLPLTFKEWADRSFCGLN